MKQYDPSQKIQITRGAMNKLLTYAKLCGAEGRHKEIYAYAFHNNKLSGEYWVINDILLPPNQIAGAVEIDLVDLQALSEFWSKVPSHYERLGWVHSHADLYSLTPSGKDNDNLESILRREMGRREIKSNTLVVPNAEFSAKPKLLEDYKVGLRAGGKIITSWNADNIFDFLKKLCVVGSITDTKQDDNQAVSATKKYTEGITSEIFSLIDESKISSSEEMSKLEPSLAKKWRVVMETYYLNSCKREFREIATEYLKGEEKEFEIYQTGKHWSEQASTISKYLEGRINHIISENRTAFAKKLSEKHKNINALLIEYSRFKYFWQKINASKEQKPVSFRNQELIKEKISRLEFIVSKYNAITDTLSGDMPLDNELEIGVLLPRYDTFVYSIIVNALEQNNYRGYAQVGHASEAYDHSRIDPIREVSVDVIDVETDVEFEREALDQEVKDKVRFRTSRDWETPRRRSGFGI